MKLSVIIAVFNGEATIEKCLNSIIDQTFISAQIIVVDDGSFDRTPAILKKKSQIEVYTIKNSGLAAARNYGLQFVKGDYITFVDADDFVDLNTYAFCDNFIYENPDVDILEFPFSKIMSDKQMYCQLDTCSIYGTPDIFKYYVSQKLYRHSFVCNKIFRKSLFDNISFKPGIYYEDFEIFPRLISVSNCYASISSGCYNYVWRNDSITSLLSGFSDLLHNQINTFNLLVKLGFSIKSLAAFWLDMLDVQIVVFSQSPSVSLLVQPKVSDILMSDSSLKQKIKALFCKLFGIKAVCKLLSYKYKK